MTKYSDNEIWVFLSHSNKDYEKVIKVRDLLEENSFRPLMFFLKCLNDDDEIDDLIKREIDSRGRFILCDSENARNSEWVQREVEYIKSKRRVYQTIDIEAPVDKIAEDVLNFKKKSTVYVSHANKDYYLYLQLASMLRSDWDFAVSDPRLMPTGIDYAKTVELTMDYALVTGMIFFLITEAFVASEYCVRELAYVLAKTKDTDFHNIIILLDKSLPQSVLPHLLSIQNIPICEITISSDNLVVNSRKLYWEFMKEQINEGVSRRDPHALFILAEHFYWDDDRFDSYFARGMRVAAARLAKEAADKGHTEAQWLYESIIHEYPDIKEEIK